MRKDDLDGIGWLVARYLLMELLERIINDKKVIDTVVL